MPSMLGSAVGGSGAGPNSRSNGAFTKILALAPQPAQYPLRRPDMKLATISRYEFR